jgi:acetyl-CoA carboxylase carboxyltransferase component
MGENVHDKIEDLRKRRAQVMEGGGPARIQKIHDSGRLTARERINLLLDEGTFEETGVFVTHR